MCPKSIHEPGREIPVTHETDVVVAGAGLSGCATAVAAARTGASVVLIDRNNAPGGNATSGMIGGITNLFLTPEGDQVLAGIPAEVVERLAAETGLTWEWSAARGVPWLCFDNEILKRVLDALLEEAGVTSLYNTFVADAITDGTTVQGLLVENKSGCGAVLGKCVVDCTGDGDVAARAGAPFTHYGKTGTSLLFRLGNVDIEKTVSFVRDNPKQLHPDADQARKRLALIERGMQLGMFSLYDHDGETLQPLVNEAVARGDFSTEAFGWPRLNRFGMEGLVRSGIVGINTGKAPLDALDPKDVCAGEISGRKMAIFVTDFLRKYVPGFENAWIIGTASSLGVRVGRFVHGERDYQLSDMGETRSFPDAIARACVGVMSIGDGYDTKTTWSDKVIEVPYRCLVPKEVDHLLMGSGRSFPLQPLRVVRETPLCMAVGQAGGTAAALSVRSECRPRDLDVDTLRQALRNQGVLL